MSDEALQAFSRRINEICDDMGVPPKGQARQTTVAKLFDVTQKGARKWLEGEGYPSLDTGRRIALWAHCSFDWLMTGRPPKRPGDEGPPEVAALITTIRRSSAEGTLSPELAKQLEALIETTSRKR